MQINRANYKQVLIQYLENELSGAEKAKADKFIRENEYAAYEWTLLKQTRMKPDAGIGFPNKQMLFRREEEDVPVVEMKQPVVVEKRPVVMVKMYRWSAIAVAAAILAFAILVRINRPADSSKMAQTGNNATEKQSGIGTTGKDSNTKGGIAYISNDINKATPPDPKKAPLNITTPKKKDKDGKDIQGKNKKDIRTPEPQKGEHRNIIIVEHPADKNQMAVLVPHSTNIATSFNPANDVTQGTGLNKVAVAVNTPKKNVQQPEDNDKTLAGNFFDFLNKVSVKKKQINEKTYYALSIETSDIKIDKTFKSLIDR